MGLPSSFEQQVLLSSLSPPLLLFFYPLPSFLIFPFLLSFPPLFLPLLSSCSLPHPSCPVLSSSEDISHRERAQVLRFFQQNIWRTREWNFCTRMSNCYCCCYLLLAPHPWSGWSKNWRNGGLRLSPRK